MENEQNGNGVAQRIVEPLVVIGRSSQGTIAVSIQGIDPAHAAVLVQLVQWDLAQATKAAFQRRPANIVPANFAPGQERQVRGR